MIQHRPGKHANKKQRTSTKGTKQHYFKHAALAILLSSSLQVAAAETELNIPAQPLDKALNALAKQSGERIVFSTDLTEKVAAPAIKGKLTTQQALEKLLTGSGLVLQHTGNNSFTVIKASLAKTELLPEVAVSGASNPLPGELPKPYAGGQVARGSRAGLLGNKSVLDTPFNTTSYTSELMENQQAITVADVLANDPSVRTVSYGLTNSAAGGEIFLIRGLSVQDSMLFDGIPGIISGRVGSAEIAERIELLKGPNALLNGMAPGAGGAVGGAINLVPKRADDQPLTRFTTTYMSDSNFAGHLDLGRRFGEDKQWGIRFNGIYRDGNTATDGQSVKLGTATIGIDYWGTQFRASLDAGHQTMNNKAPQGAAGFGIDDGVQIPSPPSATNRIGQDWEYSKSRSNFLLAKAEYDISPDWMVYGAVGGSDTGRATCRAIFSSRTTSAMQPRPSTTGPTGARTRWSRAVCAVPCTPVPSSISST